MLVLTRRLDETIMLGDPLSPDDTTIEVTVIEVRGDQVRLGIKAPRTTAVHRKEVYESIQQENREAAKAVVVPEIRLPR